MDFSKSISRIRNGKTILSASNISSPNHSNRWSLYINANGKLQFDNGITSINFFRNTVLELNKFYHFAIEKNNKMLYLFINGKLENFTNVSQEYTSINYIKIGSQMSNNRLFQGDIDELRVSNIARWVPINNIELNKTTDSLILNDPIKGAGTLTAVVAPDNVTSKTVTWKSSNTNIVTVDGYGNITGIKAGTVVITATTADGKSVSCKVTVKDKETGKSKLIIYMGSQVTREYYLTDDEIGNFINWYDARANGQTPRSYYVFNVPAQGVLPARKDYVLFDKIKVFEVE